jgi:hypothetical protein
MLSLLHCIPILMGLMRLMRIGSGTRLVRPRIGSHRRGSIFRERKKGCA